MYNEYNYKTANPLYYGLLKEYARENKMHQTEAEDLLWNHLLGNPWGLHFRRQHIIGCYIADFICLKAKTVIEVDGGYHSQDKQQLEDYLRTKDLEEMGFSVIRFTNDSIFSNLSDVLDRIFSHVAKNINH